MHTTEYNSTAAITTSVYVCSHLSGVQPDKWIGAQAIQIKFVPNFK